MRAKPPGGGRFAGELDDEELALLFTAYHSRVPPASQVGLALRVLMGPDHATIAAGLLCSEAVLTVLALAFHAGARARAHAGLQGGHDATQLCWEAIRLARALAAHATAAHPDADALAALLLLLLLLLHGARLTGALDAAGDMVLLPGQPRGRWDGGMVRLGLLHQQRAQRAVHLSRWHLQAGIAAEHAAAADCASTDWPTIVQYVDTLLALDGSAAPRLGQGIALAEAGEPVRVLALLQAMQPEVPPALQANLLAAQARAHERLGDVAKAHRQLLQAVAATPHAADARALARRAEALARPV